MEVKLIKKILTSSVTLNKWYRVISADITGINTFSSFKILNDHGQEIILDSNLFSWKSCDNVVPHKKYVSVDSRIVDFGSSENNGGSTSYYKINPNWKDLQDVIEERKMTYAQGNVLKSAFTFNVGRHGGTDELREINKIIYFAERIREEILNSKK